MSTRALIARKTKDGWEANYHHWDGYPAGLGAALYELYNGYFEKNAKAMLMVLLDEHPAGWSTIIGRDFSLEPGFNEDFKVLSDAPECFCHGDRSEGPQELFTDKDKDFGGAEYCYVIDPETSEMEILERFYTGGKWGGDRAVQFFGVDASQLASTAWRTVAILSLDDEEPDWEGIGS